MDNLYSENDVECYEATNKIKNLVIGSNKQKKLLIQQGVVPRLLSILQNEDKPLYLRHNVLIIIGSLAKGTEANIQDLDKHGSTEILLNLALSGSTDAKMIELSLSVLKSIMQYPNKIRNSFFQYSEDIPTLSRLIRKCRASIIINSFKSLLKLKTTFLIIFFFLFRTCVSRDSKLSGVRRQYSLIVHITEQCFDREYEFNAGRRNSVFGEADSI